MKAGIENERWHACVVVWGVDGSVTCGVVW